MPITQSRLMSIIEESQAQARYAAELRRLFARLEREAERVGEPRAEPRAEHVGSSGPTLLDHVRATVFEVKMLQPPSQVRTEVEAYHFAKFARRNEYERGRMAQKRHAEAGPEAKPRKQQEAGAGPQPEHVSSSPPQPTRAQTWPTVPSPGGTTTRPLDLTQDLLGTPKGRASRAITQVLARAEWEELQVRDLELLRKAGLEGAEPETWEAYHARHAAPEAEHVPSSGPPAGHPQPGERDPDT